MDNVERMTQYFYDDNFATGIGILIEAIDVDNETAVCMLEITDFHRNAAGVIQGGVIYTLADFAFAVLSNFDCPITVTGNASITYLMPANGYFLRAKAKYLAKSGRKCTVGVEVLDSEDKCVAYFVANGVKLNHK